MLSKFGVAKVTVDDIRGALVLHPSVKSTMEKLLDGAPYAALKHRPQILAFAECPEDKLFLVNDTAWDDMQQQLHEAIERLKEKGLI